MAGTERNSLPRFTPGIRILGLNTDRSRRTLGSYSVYQVFFELSGAPPLIWGEMFGREWKDLNPAKEAGIDGRFLVLHCPLEEIAGIHLPALKKAVEAANVAFKQYARDRVKEEELQGNIRMEERIALDDVARSLKFE